VLNTGENLQRFFLPIAQTIMIGLAVLLLISCLGAAFGIWPWLQLNATVNGNALGSIGIGVQLTATTFMILLLAYLPSNLRMARLERSHRSFIVGMEDVARAYAHAHAGDRAQVFTLSSEFESMRQRMDYMRAHPHFQELEPEILQLAAQMSLQTRDLARTYSDEKVERAKGFLRQRQQEVQLMQERLDVALKTSDELRRWLTDIEIEERHSNALMKRLEADLREILPKLGYDIDTDDPGRDPTGAALSSDGEYNVVVMQKSTQKSTK
jgi:hypothetical protein